MFLCGTSWDVLACRRRYSWCLKCNPVPFLPCYMKHKLTAKLIINLISLNVSSEKKIENEKLCIIQGICTQTWVLLFIGLSVCYWYALKVIQWRRQTKQLSWSIIYSLYWEENNSCSCLPFRLENSLGKVSDRVFAEVRIGLYIYIYIYICALLVSGLCN